MINLHSLTLILIFNLFNLEKAFAWGDMGHQTVGEIAERYLTPKAATAIVDIMGPEKLAIAATWPDAVKDDSDFNIFKAYHYIDLADDKSYETMPVFEHDPKDSVTVLKNYPLILQDTEAPRSAKIVALKYLIHIVGDIHQPLHVGHKEDVGGNLCRVEWANNEILNLHQVWDSKIIENDISSLKSHQKTIKFYNFKNYADDILKNNPLNPLENEIIDTLNFYQWIKESQDLRSSVYLYYDQYKNCKNIDSIIPKLTDAYKSSAAATVEKRLLYGGKRLALMLNQIFKNGSNPGKNISLSKQEILQKLEFTNTTEVL